METFMRILLVTFFLSLTSTSGTKAEKPEVDLLLVFAIDVSMSVDDEEFKIQREGYARALSDPLVIRAATAGPLGRIAVAFVEWSGSGPNYKKVIIDWTVIDGPLSAYTVGKRLTAIPRSSSHYTAIGEAIEFSSKLIANAPFESHRKVIDVSGDGANHIGIKPRVARDQAVENGITINGLVILSETPYFIPEHTHPPGGLEKYYRDNVAGGPGSFVEVAEGFQSFPPAILRKMVQEIALHNATRPPG